MRSWSTSAEPNTAWVTAVIRSGTGRRTSSGCQAGDLIATDRLEERLNAAVDQTAEGVIVHLDVADTGRDFDRASRRGSLKVTSTRWMVGLSVMS